MAHRSGFYEAFWQKGRRLSGKNVSRPVATWFPASCPAVVIGTELILLDKQGLTIMRRLGKYVLCKHNIPPEKLFPIAPHPALWWDIYYRTPKTLHGEATGGIGHGQVTAYNRNGRRIAFSLGISNSEATFLTEMQESKALPSRKSPGTK